jgi:NADPH:quinone reductase-like Zn-dependent oxidoreductase
MFEEMNRAIAVAGMHPPIDRSFDFEDARGAYEYLLGASHSGKVTIRL